jgi:hypothetical protein
LVNLLRVDSDPNFLDCEAAKHRHEPLYQLDRLTHHSAGNVQPIA